LEVFANRRITLRTGRLVLRPLTGADLDALHRISNDPLPQWWGRGLATEAARECLRYAFEEVGLGRVVAGADPPNVASLRVIERLGMKPIGDIAPDQPGIPYFALSRDDFLDLVQKRE
jgi:RimJ/RimL family protein N-acetyltransferase